MKALLLILLIAAPVLAQPAARVEFSPYPSDQLTVPDSRQRTGLRMNLPLPDCNARPTDCAEIRLVNELDGFHANPRMTVTFSAAIDPETLRDGIRIAWLESKTPGRFDIYPAGKLSPINQVTYDPATRTASFRPDEVLQNSRRFLLVVTDAVRDASGNPVAASPEYEECLRDLALNSYCSLLKAAVDQIAPALGGQRIVGASHFTTLSATAFLEEARRLINEAPAPIIRAGTIVPLDGLLAISLQQQVRTSPGNQFDVVTYSSISGPINLLSPGRMAFASFRSPRYLGVNLTIPSTPTGTPLAAASETSEIPFHVFLPASAPPPGGYPVLLAAHGLGDSRFGMPTALMALAHLTGYAVVAMNSVGHGYGPNSAVVFLFEERRIVEVAAPGRGLDIDGNQRIDAFEGCIVVAPGSPIGARDCIRQTVIDYLQLVRALRAGVDLDGDGRVDLNREGIGLVGQSFGGWIGTLVMALEPSIGAAVLNVAPANAVETARLSPTLRLIITLLVGLRQPSLLNRGFDFDENIPLRNEPVRLQSIAGAAAIQEVLDRFEWIEASGAGLYYAPHLKSATLPGVGSKQILWQMAWGDRTVPNPSTSALIRAANMTDSFVVYRHDLAREVAPLDVNPHSFLIPIGSPQAQMIGLAAMSQALIYVTDSRATIIDANRPVRGIFGRDIFERPANPPNGANY